MQSQTADNPEIRRSVPGRILWTCYVLKWRVLSVVVIHLTERCIAYPQKVWLDIFLVVNLVFFRTESTESSWKI